MNAFFMRTPAGHRPPEKFAQLGSRPYGIYIRKPFGKLAGRLIAQSGDCHGALLADVSQFGGMKSKLQTIDLGQHASNGEL